MPRDKDKHNGRRGPAGDRPRGKGSSGGKGSPGSKGRPRGPGKPPGRGERSRPREADKEWRKEGPAEGRRGRPAGGAGEAPRPPRGRKPFRRDDERGAERAPRQAFREGEHKRHDGAGPRPPRPAFRRDDERRAERPPRKPFRDGERGRADASGARPYREDGSAPRQAGRPQRTPRREGEAAPTQRKHFSRPREERRDTRPQREADGGRGRWQEHPRSEGRGEARPPRPATGSDRAFRKHPAPDAATRPPRKPRAVQAPPPPRANKTGERIAKLVARAGLASRREAEAWITQGRVAVNGRVITSPALDVTVRDVVTVDGAVLPERAPTRLFLYHKPRGLMTTHADPEGRPTVFDNLPGGLPRLISIGRLDFNTEGLLLLTNDGGLARALELPQTGWLRRYRVRAHGEVTQPQLDALRAGLTVDGVSYGAIEATLERVQGSNVWLTFAIREGKNREVRNVLAALGLEVGRLIRVAYGPFQLGELGEGEVVEVEARALRAQIGEALLSRAGAFFPGAAAPGRSAAKGLTGVPAKAAAKPRAKRAVVADRKGRKVVVERAGGDDNDTPPRGGPAPYRRPRRRYHGKREIS